jgi:ATP-dependent exoDNAse (exonuclease V) alpha subunit
VVRGEALRILNTVGGIKSAEVSKIYRQRNEYYRSAVEDLANGEMKSAFSKLDAMGAIHQVDALKPNEKLVHAYASALKAGKSALVVSPTHQQSEQVTQSIREKLRASKLLGKKEIAATRLTNLNLTEAEKSDWRNFREGMRAQFNQNSPGLKRGSVWRIESSSEIGVRIRDENDVTALLPLHRCADFELYKQSEIPLSNGDLVRLTRNGFDRQKKRLNNGELLTVASVSKKGELVLKNTISNAKFHLDKEYGHLAHAYCITSHASQGKTVDEVFISQPAATFPATDAKQFYVSVSRGRNGVHIYTDNKEELMQYAQRLGDRQSAIELVHKKNTAHEMAEQQGRNQRNKLPALSKKKAQTKEKQSPHRPKDKSYEPEL